MRKMSWRYRFLFSLMVCLASICIMDLRCEAKSGTGKTYYVSVDGDDRQRGTKNAPFLTIQKGVSVLKSGDTLLIGKGTYREEIVIPAKVKGKKNQMITIRNVPGERAIISGAGKQSPVLMTLKGTSYISIIGLEFKNAHGQNSCGIFVASKTSHFVIKGNKIHDIKVTQPSMRNHCANGIHLYGKSAKYAINDGVIENNKLYDCETGWSECVSVSGNCTNIRVKKNSIKDIGNIGIDFAGNYGYCSDPAKDFPRDCEITQNTVKNCVSGNATSYGIYVDGGQRIKIDGNIVSGCSGGIEVGAEKRPAKTAYSTANISVTNNRVENNLKNGITIGGYKRHLGWVIGVQVSGNYCKNNGINHAILTLAKCKDVVISKNTFINKTGHAAIIYSGFSKKYTKNVSFSRNTYYNGKSATRTEFVYLGKEYRTFSSWKKATGDRRSTYKK